MSSCPRRAFALQPGPAQALRPVELERQREEFTHQPRALAAGHRQRRGCATRTQRTRQRTPTRSPAQLQRAQQPHALTPPAPHTHAQPYHSAIPTPHHRKPYSTPTLYQQTPKPPQHQPHHSTTPTPPPPPTNNTPLPHHTLHTHSPPTTPPHTPNTPPPPTTDLLSDTQPKERRLRRNTLLRTTALSVSGAAEQRDPRTKHSGVSQYFHQHVRGLDQKRARPEPKASAAPYAACFSARRCFAMNAFAISCARSVCGPGS